MRVITKGTGIDEKDVKYARTEDEYECDTIGGLCDILALYNASCVVNVRIQSVSGYVCTVECSKRGIRCIDKAPGEKDIRNAHEIPIHVSCSRHLISCVSRGDFDRLYSTTYHASVFRSCTRTTGK